MIFDAVFEWELSSDAVTLSGWRRGTAEVDVLGPFFAWAALKLDHVAGSANALHSAIIGQRWLRDQKPLH